MRRVTAESELAAPGVIEVDPAATPGARVVVTTRTGGVSVGPHASLNLGGHVGDDPAAVAENRARVARALGVEPTHLVIADQVHGARVVELDRPWPSLEADGLTTTSSDLALAVLVADCVPVALVNPERVAVIHAGWRGLALGVLAAGLARFADPAAVHAVVGPAIEPARYQVGPEVVERFAAVAGALAPDAGDRSRLDLVAVTLDQLARGGVSRERTSVVARTTGEAEAFYSARAQSPTGRFAMVARRTP
jgi:YfiH family protein